MQCSLGRIVKRPDYAVLGIMLTHSYVNSVERQGYKIWAFEYRQGLQFEHVHQRGHQLVLPSPLLEIKLELNQNLVRLWQA